MRQLNCSSALLGSAHARHLQCTSPHLERACANQAIDRHVAFLAQTEGAILRLQVDGGVPVGVDQNHPAGQQCSVNLRTAASCAAEQLRGLLVGSADS